MILEFSVENWMSFSKKTNFSMIASREQQHKDRIPYIEKYSTKVLPVAAMYGGNASGKTNFFKALDFAQDFICKTREPEELISVESFQLDDNQIKEPTRFEFVIFVDETIYEFSFLINRKHVLEEKLVEIKSSSEKTLYERLKDDITFHDSLNKNDRLHFAFEGTQANQLYLSNSVSQKLTHFSSVYKWFKNCLEMVAPDSTFGPFEQFLDDENPLYSIMNDFLPLLDTSISHLGGEEVPLDSIAFPEHFDKKLLDKIMEGSTGRLTFGDNDRFSFTRKNDKLIAKKLVTYHTKVDGTDAKFEIEQESDGSKRVIELLPGILDLIRPESTKVYVVDELDRSLHTLLIKLILNLYLKKCSKTTRSQLLFTTHNLLLMDQKLFRRDEMWVSERNSIGMSKLISFGDYKEIRSDTDIRKNYLQGRLGGIPRFLVDSSIIDTTEGGENLCEEKKKSI